jgi:hypothetical protein
MARAGRSFRKGLSPQEKTAMKSRDVSMIAVAAGSFALAFGAVATEGSLQTMDTDKDGIISAAEHAAGARQTFKEMDADTDGQVTATEMDAAHRHGAINAAKHEAGSQECSRIRTSTAMAIVRKRNCRPGHQAGEQPR